jgi:uncharacterized protein YciU (UPF0263 family)
VELLVQKQYLGTFEKGYEVMISEMANAPLHPYNVITTSFWCEILQRGAVEIHSPMCFWIVAVGTPLGSTIAAKVSLSLVKKMMYRLYKVHLVKHWN